MNNTQLIPHFVADRPMSLRILTGLNLHKHPVKIGLMSQACTSKNYREMVAKFPCTDLEYCGVVDGACPYSGNLKKCTRGQIVKTSFTKISDSGAFTKQGANFGYEELFQRYEQMKVERGIIIDVLKDKDETIKSAEIAWNIYNYGKHSYKFKLIAVAQGKTPDEYVECYQKLHDIGYEEIAIGGLLSKIKNTARYLSSNKQQIASIVKRIKYEWPDKRCFTLGVYHPSRHEFLESLGVDAADYKGWIFQYEKRTDNPFQHHKDRIIQTRQFIENAILSRLSGITPQCSLEDTVGYPNEEQLIAVGNRVYKESSKKNFHNYLLASNKKLVIISCGKLKNQVAQCKAKDAYLGNSFKIKRKYAENTGNPWLILSAKYGLLKPDETIDPNYDKTLKTKADIRLLSSIIEKQTKNISEINIADEITFLGPKAYVDSLKLALSKRDVNIIHLTEGLSQGKMYQTINNIINNKITSLT